MEVDLFHRTVVGMALRLCNQAVDSQHICLYRLGNIQSGYDSCDVSQIPVHMMVMMIMRVVMFKAMPVVMVLAVRMSVLMAMLVVMVLAVRMSVLMAVLVVVVLVVRMVMFMAMLVVMGLVVGMRMRV
jgi:hypothetical protein